MNLLREDRRGACAGGGSLTYATSWEAAEIFMSGQLFEDHARGEDTTIRELQPGPVARRKAARALLGSSPTDASRGGVDSPDPRTRRRCVPLGSICFSYLSDFPRNAAFLPHLFHVLFHGGNRHRRSAPSSRGPPSRAFAPCVRPRARTPETLCLGYIQGREYASCPGSFLRRARTAPALLAGFSVLPQDVLTDRLDQARWGAGRRRFRRNEL